VSVALAKVTSWEDHIEAWHHLGREVDGAAWARAAIAASLKGRYGEGAISKFAKEVGFSAASIWDFARAFDVFPENSDRSENLTFTHHLHAVHYTKTAKQARDALALAESEGLSANALRKQVETVTTCRRSDWTNTWLTPTCSAIQTSASRTSRTTRARAFYPSLPFRCPGFAGLPSTWGFPHVTCISRRTTATVL
jgi:hypothetical protein